MRRVQLSSDHTRSVRARDWWDGSSLGSVPIENKSSAHRGAISHCKGCGEPRSESDDRVGGRL